MAPTAKLLCQLIDLCSASYLSHLLPFHRSPWMAAFSFVSLYPFSNTHRRLVFASSRYNWFQPLANSWGSYNFIFLEFVCYSYLYHDCFQWAVAFGIRLLSEGWYEGGECSGFILGWHRRDAFEVGVTPTGMMFGALSWSADQCTW